MSTTYRPRGDWDEFLDISMGYAHVPAAMMNVDFRFSGGSVPVRDLPRALARARVAPIDPHVASDLRTGNVVDMGRTRDQISWYRDRIVRLLEICVEREVPLDWS